MSQCEHVTPERLTHTEHEDADGLVYGGSYQPAMRCPFETADGERRCEAHRERAVRAA